MTKLLHSAEQAGGGGANGEAQVRKGWTPLVTGSRHRSLNRGTERVRLASAKGLSCRRRKVPDGGAVCPRDQQEDS